MDNAEERHHTEYNMHQNVTKKTRNGCVNGKLRFITYEDEDCVIPKWDHASLFARKVCDRSHGYTQTFTCEKPVHKAAIVKEQHWGGACDNEMVNYYFEVGKCIQKGNDYQKWTFEGEDGLSETKVTYYRDPECTDYIGYEKKMMGRCHALLGSSFTNRWRLSVPTQEEEIMTYPKAM
mmetsp:Transcript_9222/g.13664  ORF Transcript_9222/g.13664 Transcript_9222/m.13664 type:complete len:178 (+) Transcript_9222:166-699(+)